MYLNPQENKEKSDMNTLRTVQAYLIGTVNTIQSIQCSENTSVGYQMEHKWKSAKTHHLVDLTKEKKSYSEKQIK